MQCIFCKSQYPSVKNGFDRRGDQRYKCQNCKRTFTDATKQNLKISESKRLVLHLILAGCGIDEIAKELGIAERVIKRWKKLHFKEIFGTLPDQPLLSIITLRKIYKAIERKRIAAINIIQRKNKFPY